MNKILNWALPEAKGVAVKLAEVSLGDRVIEEGENMKLPMGTSVRSVEFGG